MTNRITPYGPGWLQFLVERRLATAAEARDAQNRVALAAVERLMQRKKKRKKGRDQ
jgi:hypothetical protein